MTTPQEFHAMTGAYAVDALDDTERAAFEEHLTECPDCRAEVASLREAAALLAETTAIEPPAALRDRVLADITSVRPLPPEVPAPVVPLAERRRRRPRLLLAAAAAVVLVGAGAVVWQQPWDDSSTTQLTGAAAVLAASDARSTSLDFPSGASATVTHSDSLGEAVIVTKKMPAPPAGKVYQLWLDQPGVGMVSAGVMPVEEDQTVLLTGDAATATGAGITVEPEGGSDAPTSKPIALFDFGRSKA
ncbi:anti-sigma factor [Nocardioides mangrovi]|uniref:Regulator of SigK n=1 Tax=Nocardioides mangrovi TaxID=2874580 RepID=A0ABS7UB17_9ACTN|nr:anti-sigma factor [Nocardioides mangrovi]MBZ5738029.1 anti-sigma factor [Nocardioides mangrovi]